MNCTSVTPQSDVVYRLCTKRHEYCVNIFISNELCEIIVEETIQDLLGLPVAVGDGLPSVVCRLCLRKLIEFREFKNMCFKSATELRTYGLGNGFIVSKTKDEYAADVETSREGSSQENTFLNDVHVTEVYITTPNELAIGNVSHAKEELWSPENALVVKDEVCDGVSYTEGDVTMTALTSFAVDPLAVDTMALKEEAQEPKGTGGKGNSLGDTSPHNHIQVTEVFVPVPDELAMGIVRYAEEDSRPTEWIIKEEIGEGLECSDNDIPVGSLSCVNVDPLAVDTTVDRCNNIEGLMGEPEKESDNFGADTQGISQNQVLNNPSCYRDHEENLHLEYSKPKTFVLDCFTESRVTKQTKNVKCCSPSEKESQLNYEARPVRNHEREQLGHLAENTRYTTEYVCNYCNTRYSEKNSLALHIKIHVDGITSASILPKKDIKPRFSQNLVVKAFKCNECGKMFTTKSNLKTHSVIHTGVKSFKCNECGKMFTTSNDLRIHSRIHSGVKPFKCDECGKMFYMSSHLKTHSAVHTGVKPYKCDECGKTFTTSSTLKSHSLIHTGVKPFKCDECGKMFPKSSHLITHSAVHTGVKPFKCNECGKTYTTSSTLKSHSLIHTGVKPFKCDECGKMFTKSNHLKTHSVVHSGEKSFKCNECGKMFSQSSHLKTHSAVHTGVKPFKCNECGRMFSTKGGLIRHSLIHTGVKRLKCNECGKTFYTSSDLKKHSVVHTCVKRSKCNVCGKIFTRSGYLRRHSRIHSGVTPL